MIAPRYRDYKTSGAEWLGQIPEHWDVKRLKFLGDAITGLTYAPENIVEEGDGILVLRSSNVQNGRIVYDDNVFVATHVPDELRTRPDDILICSRNGSRALIGKNAIIDQSSAGVTFGAFMTVFRTPHSGYLRWVFNSLLFDYQSGSFLTSTINQLTIGVLNDFAVPFPPSEERRLIAEFLSEETTKIDRLIEDQRRLIGLLNEKRQAVISNAVTKGLNPDAPMRPSGVEWLGEVPAHWDLNPLRRFPCLVQTGPFGSQLHADEYVAGGIPVVNPMNMDSGRIVPNDQATVTTEVLDRLPHQRLRAGDVVFARRGDLGRCALVTDIEEGWLCGTGSMILRFNQGHHHSAYVARYLSLDVVRQYFESFSIGATMDSISAATVMAMPILAPPAYEQLKIAQFVTLQATRFDTLSLEAQRTIDLLQERRTALISAAVTGQVDVRGLAEVELA